MQRRMTKKYWTAYSALHNTQNNEKIPIAARKSKPTRHKGSGSKNNSTKGLKTPSESVEQKIFCKWLNNNHVLHYAIPNGGKRHWLEAYNLKLQGVQAGVPDLCIPVARFGRHSLYIEMKRVKGGVVAEAQQLWHDRLRAEGHAVVVAYGADHAIRAVQKYLGWDSNGKQVL